MAEIKLCSWCDRKGTYRMTPKATGHIDYGCPAHARQYGEAYDVAELTEYVQAWKCRRNGRLVTVVYDQGIAVDMHADGCDIEIMTIVRHADESREYLPGTVATEVARHREGHVQGVTS